MDLIEKTNNLAELEMLCRRCALCPLAGTRQNVVFGQGSGETGIFMLGEAPGAKEDQLGQPFVGRAGDVLNLALGRAGLDRDQVFITGSVKCRPPRNRNPHRDEIAACRAYLDRQLKLLASRVVVCMGLVAVQNLLSIKPRLADIRGKLFDGPSCRLLPTYHPAAVLRGSAPMEALVEDFRLAAFEAGLTR